MSLVEQRSLFAPPISPTPSQLHLTVSQSQLVTDFTYVATWSGFVHVVFAIDLYSRAIVGWPASTVKDTAFVEACLKMAIWRRDHARRPVERGMIHHSDAGSIEFTQYT